MTSLKEPKLNAAGTVIFFFARGQCFPPKTKALSCHSRGLLLTLDTMSFELSQQLLVCSHSTYSLLFSLSVLPLASKLGAVLWVIVGEMFPFRTRGKVVGAATMSHWIFTTIVGAVFLIASSKSLAGCFFFFAAMVFIGICAVCFYQVQTAEKTMHNHKPGLKRKDWQWARAKIELSGIR